MQIAAIDATPPVPQSKVAKQITVLKVMHMMKRALFPIYPTPPLGQDMIHGQFLSGV